MSETKADTVPGLGFKDKEKAEETIKNLEGRDPDYQRLAIKGLIGRAKRTLTLTKDKDKLQNINDAMEVFETWLTKFELNNLSKENRAYLPLASIEALLPLRDTYKIENKLAERFLEAYKKKAKGEYKNLRTVASGEDKPTWDIVRNAELKKLLKAIGEEAPEMWKDDLPTKEHMEIILWAYSPDASKIKKNVSTYEKKLGSGKESEDEEMNTDEEDEEKDDEKDDDEKCEKDKKQKKPEKGSKRKSSGDSSEDEADESPKKKNKGNS
ncbi:uracil-DNA degrading factor [Leptinotarsa decemlineata]|uniref:uracil-DNA degrading factor n=1 Tax=Leptinotarsa decemlineata TaxID=7539 RepID=UPI003D30A02E